jgi:hypothetical protein
VLLIKLRFLKINMSIEIKKVVRVGQAWADKFVLAGRRGLPGFFFTYKLPSVRLSLGSSGPRKLKFEGFAHFF